jgi:glycosyltransferase involved in cell wall biosynthesis
MNILFVITKSELGGAQTHVSQLSTYLKRNGHVVHVAAFPGGWLQSQTEKVGISFHPIRTLSNSLDPLKGAAAARDILRLTRAIGPDIVHCHSSAAGLWTRLAVRNAIPTVFTAHGWGFTPGTPRLRRLALLVAEKLVSRFTALIICVSDYDRSLATKYGIASSHKIAVVHNGIEAQERADHKPGLGPIKAVFVGRLAKPKDPESLVRALSELPEQVRGAYELQIIGDGPLLAELQERVTRHAANVRLAGALSREDVLRVLSESDIFVLISRYEGFPVSILEAMSVGLPVIASDVGGIREAVTPECGILVGGGDMDALKNALVYFAENRHCIRRRGEAARRRAETEFSIDAMCERIVSIYRRILTDAGAPGEPA